MTLCRDGQQPAEEAEHGSSKDNPVACHLGYFCISYVNLYHQNNVGDEQPGYHVT
jgi:hypothetical protein